MHDPKIETKHFFRAAIACVALASGVQAARAQDATAFQLNPAHTGSVSMPGFNPPLKLLWEKKIRGSGFTYPLIVDGMVYITLGHYDRGDYKGSDVIALDAATGMTKWKQHIDSQVHTGFTDTWSSVTYDNGKIFALDRYSVLTAYDAKTGRVKWSQLEGQYDLPNEASPPTAFDGAVYLSSYKVSAANGLIQWLGFVEGGGVTSPAIGDGGMYETYVCQYYKFRLTDGFPLWHRDLGCGGGGGSVPQYLGSQLFVRETSGLAPNSILDSQTGAKLGTFPQLGGSNMVPALYEDAGSRFMIGPNGTALVKYDVTNPAAVSQVWSTSLNNEPLASAPLVVNGYAIEGTSKGGLYVLSPAGQIVWSTKLHGSVAFTNEHGNVHLSGLAAGDGLLVVPTQSDQGNRQTLYAFAPQ